MRFSNRQRSFAQQVSYFGKRITICFELVQRVANKWQNRSGQYVN
jgi:hypothetical protein